MSLLSAVMAQIIRPAGGGGGGLWTPADITTALWLDADDAGTLTLDGSSNAEQWNDKSGNARHLLQATAIARPAFVAAAVGGTKPTLQFDGSNDQLVHSTALIPNTYTCFAVSKNRNLAATSIVVVQGTTGSAGRVAMYGERNTSNMRGFNLVGVTGHFLTGDRSGDYVIHGWQRNGATSRVRWNGITGDGSVTTNTVQNTAFRLAAGYGGFYPVDISEVIIADGFLSEAECQRIEGYLAWKWGLEANLPGDHPYKSAAPTVAPLWTPAEITTALWLDADDADTLTLDGDDNVEQWDDKSGNARHATQGTASRRPGYNSSTGALIYTGSELVTIPQFNFAEGVVYLVAECTAGSGNNTIIRDAYVGTWRHIFRWPAGNATFSGFVQTDAGTSSSSDATVTSGAGLKMFGVEWLASTGRHKIYDAGDVVADIARTGANLPLAKTIGIGADPLPANYMTGTIREIIYVPSGDDRQTIEGYLAWKWGLEANLPADHPYKSAAPTV